MRTLGSVNPCRRAYCYDKSGKRLGSCLNTPNELTRAINHHPEITMIKVYDHLFGDETYSADDHRNRPISDPYGDIHWEEAK